jgi:VanZ family protein
MLRIVNRWLPVVVWMAFIFAMSTGLGSAEHTSRFIGPFLHWLLPDASAETIAGLHFLIRKAAHFTEYAILALLLLRALGPGGFRSLGLALLIAAAYAGTDEFHQSFVAGRTPSLGDVLIDTGGAFVALAMAAIWSARRGGKNAAIGANSLQ